MADIFLSYDSEGRPDAELLAAKLDEIGWSVWWDQVIPVGETWSGYIKHQLDEARCIVVLWSSNSVTSRWVAKEARYAIKKRILLPARIEDVEPPFEFNEVQAANLVDWDGGESEGFKHFISSITRRVPPSAPDESRDQPSTEPEPSSEETAIDPRGERALPPEPTEEPHPAEEEEPEPVVRMATAREPFSAPDAILDGPISTAEPTPPPGFRPPPDAETKPRYPSSHQDPEPSRLAFIGVFGTAIGAGIAAWLYQLATQNFGGGIAQWLLAPMNGSSPDLCVKASESAPWDDSARLRWRPPWARGATGPGSGGCPRVRWS